MRLADTADSSIYMGEGSLDEEVLAVLFEVFGDTLEFQLTLSCNSDWESISACIKFNEEDLKLIVPGIRSTDDNSNDQKRTMSAKEAINAGADILVIGRPITQADDPAEAAFRIYKSL